MLGRPTTANLARGKSMKSSSSPVNNKPKTANVMYARIPAFQRILQQQRPLGSPSLSQSSQSKRGMNSAQTSNREKSDSFSQYHPWKDEYSQIIIRDKKLKSMTKDPYTPLTRLISHAVERVTTVSECCSPLVSAKAVKMRKVNVRQSAQPILPRIVRYLRRGDLLPSERLSGKSNTVKMPFVSQLDSNTLLLPIQTTHYDTSVTPTLETQVRLINRAKMRANPPVVRRPPRKLNINFSHETIVTLPVYA